MKLTPFLALLGALATFSAQAVVTTPVGFYNFDGKSGGNLVVPAFVNSAAYSGAITGSGATTLDVAAAALVAGAFDAGATYPTHYVEITSGDNAGVVVDIASNTDSQITLVDDISLLGLVGDESITVRPHVTLGGVFEGDEGDLGFFSSSATFYFPDGSATTYLYTGSIWSSDGATPDGEDVPIAPGTGFVLNLAADTSLTMVGEVKASPTVVQLAASGFVNIVGPTNPLVGDTTALSDVGFGGLAAFADSVTRYTTDGSIAPVSTYLVLIDGSLSTDGATPTTDTLNNTTGVVISSPAGGSATIETGFTVAE